MKIIARTGTLQDSGFIIEMTDDELANLTGYYYADSDFYRKVKPAVGAEVLIAGMFKQLRAMAELETTLRDLQASLRAAALVIELPEPFKPLIPSIKQGVPE